MYERPYDLVHGPDGYSVRIRARGNQVLTSPLLNRGTAFTAPQRRALGLTGLLPTEVTTMTTQLRRVYAQYGRQPGDLAKNVYLGNLRDRNEVLFYRLLVDHLTVMLPIVYTPTIGLAIERFSQEFRRPRGVYLSVDDRRTPSRRCAITAAARTTSTSSSPPTGKASSASATRAWGASISRPASCRSTPRRPASTHAGWSRSCWMSAPTTCGC